MKLPPAEAMRPEPPAVYRPTFLERMGLQRWFSQATRMILRHLERQLLTLRQVAALAWVGRLPRPGSSSILQFSRTR